MTGRAKLFRTSTFRLAALYLILFAVSVSALLGYVYWNTAVLLQEQTDYTIQAEVQGLAEIVVAAGAQALHPLVHVGERGEDQHRGLDVVLAQLADDGEAVNLRQHAIDDQHVVHGFERQAQPFLAVGGMVGDMAGLGQALHQPAGSFAVVFDD